MQYEQALRQWGAIRLQKTVDLWAGVRFHEGESINVDTVIVEVTMDPGYACCGGRDPGCYCSMAESPRASVDIKGKTLRGKHVHFEIHSDTFDFVTMLKELVEVAEGEVTA